MHCDLSEGPSHTAPEIDESNDLIFQSATYTAPYTTLTVKRSINTGDKDDVAIRVSFNIRIMLNEYLRMKEFMFSCSPDHFFLDGLSAMKTLPLSRIQMQDSPHWPSFLIKPIHLFSHHFQSSNSLTLLGNE
jgi:hypothetical protein